MKKKLFSALLSFALALSLLPTAARATEQEYDLASGSITVSVDNSGTQTVTQNNNAHTQDASKETVIKQTDSATATTNTITITAAENQTAKVTLSGVNIDVSSLGGWLKTGGAAAVSTSGAGNVTIELDGTNTIKSSYNYAGLEKNNTGTLTISDANNDGSLNATGGAWSAGIGGDFNRAASNIIINGGKVTATGGDNGAGIGGGANCAGSNITISGGTVTATGGIYAAGIGGGGNGDGFNIKITGGTVVATGGNNSAGIGGGSGHDGSNITISGGTVTATGTGMDSYIGSGGAGIGGGNDGDGSNIKITGGTVTAVGATGGAGIGGGQGGTGSGITVSGSAKLTVQGGEAFKPSDDRFPDHDIGMLRSPIGAGAGIGNGGSTDTEGKAVSGEEVTPDTSKLASDGEIKYYAPGEDIKSSKPIDPPTSKTTPTLTFAGTVYSNVGTTSFNYSYDGDGTVRASSSDEAVAKVYSADAGTVIVDVIRAGTATITVSADSGANSAAAADLTYVLTVKEYVAPSYIGAGDSSPSRYAVSVDEAEHGSVSVSRANASSGATVTVTTTPDKGWTLETLTVTDRNGEEIELDIVEAGEEYTFKMPSGSVTVTATFMEDNTMLNYFVDVNARDYFYDAVLWAVEKGVTDGTDALHFSPNDPCTRAQIVTFLWRAAGSPEPKSASSFSDVAAGSYYAKAVAWAVEQGITGGTGNGEFSPDATCTRAQAVTFLYRASGSPTVRGDAEFSDVPATAYYANAVKWAENENVTTGIGGGLFGSNNDCTRGQIVTFLWRTTIE